jgi:NAD(P)-dependent dehydrogenase (short-subunit alcohol dehydrogenase family)
MSGPTQMVIGGTSGIGLEIARAASARGDRVVITGRDEERAAKVAETIGDGVRGLGLDLAEPTELASRLEDVDRVDRLVLSAVERDQNAIETYDIAGAMRLVTLKLVGYTEVVHALLPRMPRTADTSIVVFGGRAKDRPYPGSTTVSTVNGGVDGLIRALALQIAPIRINALHPGIVGDSPFWAGKPAEVLDAYKARTPGGELATMADIVDAVEFLLRNRAMTAASIYVDCGWEVT